MGVEAPFDLNRCDIFPTANDQIFFAIHDLDVAFVVNSGHVTGKQPSLSNGLISSGFFQ